MSFRFNVHPELNDDDHAFLSPSQYHWINYDDTKLISAYQNRLAKEKGTEDHKFACECIKRRDRLADFPKPLNMHVNDAIGFGMNPEQKLKYSDFCFGTADAISFEDGVLRIHDLKTGYIPAHMEQLQLYVALFCLEYKLDPRDIKVETRIYQNGDIIVDQPSADTIRGLMETIIRCVAVLDKYDRAQKE